MQFPYPTAALIAIPLRTTYLWLRTTIVLPAMPIRSAVRTDPVRRYDISTTAHTNHPRRCAHHPAAHLFNLVSALYFH